MPQNGGHFVFCWSVSIFSNQYSSEHRIRISTGKAKMFWRDRRIIEETILKYIFGDGRSDAERPSPELVRPYERCLIR